jgi:hypothetical protein
MGNNEYITQNIPSEVNDASGDHSSFPLIRNSGYVDLYALIQRFGGRNALSCRFSMQCLNKGGSPGRGDYEGVYTLVPSACALQMTCWSSF